jgi:hypothetical protein
MIQVSSDLVNHTEDKIKLIDNHEDIIKEYYEKGKVMDRENETEEALNEIQTNKTDNATKVIE